MTLLLRLSPIIPFNLFNYLMGVTKVGLKQYAFGGVGMIPGTAVFVYFGTALSNVSDAASGNSSGGLVQIILLPVGAVLAILAIWYVSFVARKEIKKVLKKAEDEKAMKEVEEKGENVEEPQDLENQEANINIEKVPNIEEVNS